VEPKKYQFKNIAPELSVKMFEDHALLYESYVERLNSTMEKLSNPYDPELIRSAATSGGPFRGMHEDRTYLTNAVLLHELFFENVILPPDSPPMTVGPMFSSLLQEYYPNLKASDFWSHIVKPIAKAARGWCIVGWDTIQAKLTVCMIDDHNTNIIIGCYPLLVIDVWEHAYTQQYGIDRGTYLDHLYRSVNWSVVEHRVATVHSASEMMRTAVPEEAEDYIRDMQKQHREDSEFGFPDENYFESGELPQGGGLDTRQEEAIKQNPRVHSSVTTADLEAAYDKIKLLSKVSFSQTFEDLFDSEVRGKDKDFREKLWSMLREEQEDK